MKLLRRFLAVATCAIVGHARPCHPGHLYPRCLEVAVE
jgi:hypothetical protein